MNLLERLKNLFKTKTKTKKVWKLTNVREKGAYLEADMDAEEFDRNAKGCLVLEINGRQQLWLTSPACPVYLIYRKEKTNGL